MDNNRITDKKRYELSAKLLEGSMTEEDLAAFNDEFDKISAPGAQAAAPVMFDGTSADSANDDDDLYVPEVKKSSSFDDDDFIAPASPAAPVTPPPVPPAPPAAVGPVDGPVEESTEEPVAADEDETVDPLDISALFANDVSPPAPEPVEEEQPADTPDDTPDDAPDDTPADADDGSDTEADDSDSAFLPAAPSTATDDDDEDEPAMTVKEEVKPPIKERLVDWWDNLDPAHQKIGFGVTAAAVVLILSMILLAVFGRGGGEEAPAPVVNEPVAQAPAVNEAPEEGTLIPTSFDVSCPAGASTRPEDAFNPAEDSAWICERAHGIDGTTLTMTFDTPVEVSEVGMVPGFDYTAPRGVDEWNNHRVVTRALWRVGDEQFVQEINPARSDITMSVPGLTVQKIQVTIQATEDPVSAGGGNANAVGGADTFAISKLIIVGKQSS